VSEEDHNLLDDSIQALLKPVPGENPAGKLLLYDSVYDDIRAARTSEDENLPQGVWQRPLRKVDWTKVESLCTNALTNLSKDLQIAAWLSESWCHLYGLPGLTGGITLIYELCERYWERLYPLPRDGDMEFRLAPLEWMNEKILVLLRMFPVTFPSSKRMKPYSLLDWQSASPLAGMTGIAEQNALRRIEQESGVTLDQFNASREATSTEYYHNLKHQAQQVIEQIQQLDDFLSKKTPSFAGILHHIRDEVKNMIGFADIILSTRGVVSSSSVLTSSQQTTSEVLDTTQSSGNSFLRGNGKGIIMETKGTVMEEQQSGPSVSLSGAGAIASREEAYALLDQIATYLSTIEPHSPTPLLIRRAIAWGKMSLSEVLQELVQDKNDLIKIQSLLGIMKPTTDS
jgi:type VI secretion system protein ImpA